MSKDKEGAILDLEPMEAVGESECELDDDVYKFFIGLKYMFLFYILIAIIGWVIYTIW